MTSDFTPRPAGTLSESDIAEFQTLVREETGVLLDRTEAWSRATELIAFVRILAGALPEDPEG